MEEASGSLSFSSAALRAALIRPVCAPGSLFVTEGDAGALTFVLLLDVCVAQAHQSHLEAEDTHFAVPSAGEGGTEREKRKRSVIFKLGKMNSCEVAV